MDNEINANVQWKVEIKGTCRQCVFLHLNWELDYNVHLSIRQEIFILTTRYIGT